MRKIWILCLVTSLTLLVQIARGESISISVYFDNEYTINCMPTLSPVPALVEAYLVIEQDSPYGDLRGWEASIWVEGNVALGTVELQGNSTNFGAGNSYTVGFAESVAGADAVLVAKFQLYVTGPGSVFVAAASPTSIPGSLSPCFLDGEYNIHSLSYKYGSPSHPLATVMQTSCPEIALPDADLPLHEGQVIIVPGTEEPVRMERLESLKAAPSVKARRDEASDFDLLELCDLAFRGVLRQVSYRAIRQHNKPLGIVLLDFEIEEMYWGPALDNATVYMVEYDIPDVVQYSNYGNQFPVIEFAVGRRFLVPAFNGDLGVKAFARLFVGEGGLAGSDPDGASFEQVESELRGHSDQFSRAAQAKGGALVVRATAVVKRDEYVDFSILHDYTGDYQDGDIVTVDLSYDIAGTKYTAETQLDESYILYLGREGGTTYRLFKGPRSLIRLSDKGYLMGDGVVPIRTRAQLRTD